jgi:DNA primase
LRIPEHKIEEVRERVDILAVISRHVELKKSGRSYKGRCPFHEEKTASFHVTPDLQRFHCFGCQVGGDAIAFVQRYLGKSFVDAVRDLAREAGVELEHADDPAFRERQQLKEVTDLAAEYFRSMLFSEERGKSAREYLEGRGVSSEVAKTFGLGWAPLSWSELSDRLLKAGMLEWGAKAGLVQKRPTAEGYYDLFRGRLMIPIRSPEGRTIAFGGRLLEGADGPKYLNSRESSLYRKSDTLYGLDLAREEIRRRRSAVLVEGYFDCIGLHGAGVKNAVALCSTALTSGHLAALARADAKELVLLLDGDEAGRAAVERLAGSLLAAGAATKVAMLPEGEDPDTFARKRGGEALSALLLCARPLSQHLLDSLLPEGRAALFEAKMQALQRIKPISAQLPVGLTRSAFLAALSAHFGLPAAELEAELKGKGHTVRPVPKPSGSPAQPSPPEDARGGRIDALGSSGGAPQNPAQRPLRRPPEAVETAYVAAALRQPSLLADDPFRAFDELSHPALRTIVGALSAGQAPEEVVFDCSDEMKAAVQDASRQLPADPAELTRTFTLIGRRLKLRRIDEQLLQIARVTGQVTEASELTEETRRLQAERIDLLALKKRVIEDKAPTPAGTKERAGGV